MKKAYIKPKVKKINLLAEEAMLLGCKIGANGKPVNNGKSVKCASPIVCSAGGS